ncbi:MAG: hypothetical protein ACYDB2_00450 [Acidimicrobiales bacterium]
MTFVSTGLSKRAWLVLLAGFTVATYFVGLGVALTFVTATRATLDRPISLEGSQQRLLRSTIVLVVALAPLTLPTAWIPPDLFSHRTPKKQRRIGVRAPSAGQRVPRRREGRSS